MTTPVPIVSIFERYSRNTDKNTGHSYGPVYERILAPYRDMEGVVLELGVGEAGGALRLWREYFTRAHIVGVDKDPNRMVYGEDRITTVLANLYNLYDLNNLLSARIAPGTVNVIVDDGPHCYGQQVCCLFSLWHFLRPGGIYCIEDASELIEGAYKRLCGEMEFPHLQLLYDNRLNRPRPDDVMYVFEKPL